MWLLTLIYAQIFSCDEFYNSLLLMIFVHISRYFEQGTTESESSPKGRRCRATSVTARTSLRDAARSLLPRSGTASSVNIVDIAIKFKKKSA
ncbi:MAG: hypothetical protein ACYTX0_56615, partial [Nostoc sp.]